MVTLGKLNIKARFKKRFMVFAAPTAFFLGILSIGSIIQLIPEIRLHDAALHLTRKLVEARELAIEESKPYGILTTFNGNPSQFALTKNCGNNEDYQAQNLINETSLSKKEPKIWFEGSGITSEILRMNEICYHPQKGFLFNSKRKESIQIILKTTGPTILGWENQKAFRLRSKIAIESASGTLNIEIL